MQTAVLDTGKKNYSAGIFKRDLELQLGHRVGINLWLQARPNKPLPWSDSDLKETILNINKTKPDSSDL